MKFTGLVNKPAEFTLADLKAMKSTDLVNGYECSGNSARAFEGLSSCGRFTGVPLSSVLKQVGVGTKAREVVFSARIAARKTSYSGSRLTSSNSSLPAASRSKMP